MERKDAKETIKNLVGHLPIAKAVKELRNQVHQYQTAGNNTADMSMDPTIRILIIVGLVLLCLILLLRIIG